MNGTDFKKYVGENIAKIRKEEAKNVTERVKSGYS